MREARGRGLTGVFPSPLVMLSVTAVVMAGIAFVATRDQPETERQVQTVGQPQESTAPSPTDPGADDSEPEVKKPRPVRRDRISVVIFNNSNITGMAAEAADRAAGVGWKLVGTDNWVGTVDSSTVYFPAHLRRSAGVLARDLGIRRVKPAIDPMKMDRLTVILTDDYSA